MDQLSDLARFDLPGLAHVEPGAGGLPRLRLTFQGATAELYLHGAHVTSYVPAGQPPLLFLSQKSLFAAGKAIRGGVPLIFPWFGPDPTDSKLPAHGFARTRAWKLESVAAEQDAVTAELSLGPDAQTRQLWPHDFELRYRVILDRSSLRLELETHNRDQSAFSFEQALHTYFKVDDIRRCRIEGLGGRPYLDKVLKGQRLVQDQQPIVITGETDRVYLQTPDTVRIVEDSGRQIEVSKSGSLATVVWNPWIDKAKAMADFGDEEWPGMLCIETANAAEHAVRLEAGASHLISARLLSTR